MTCFFIISLVSFQAINVNSKPRINKTDDDRLERIRYMVQNIMKEISVSREFAFKMYIFKPYSNAIIKLVKFCIFFSLVLHF